MLAGSCLEVTCDSLACTARISLFSRNKPPVCERILPCVEAAVVDAGYDGACGAGEDPGGFRHGHDRPELLESPVAVQLAAERANPDGVAPGFEIVEPGNLIET